MLAFLLDKAQRIELLQVEPELRTGAEEVAQAQGRIAGAAPPADPPLGPQPFDGGVQPTQSLRK